MIYGDLACCAIGRAKYVRVGSFKDKNGNEVPYVSFKLEVKVKGKNVLLPFMVSKDRNEKLWNALSVDDFENHNYYVNFGIVNTKEVRNGINYWSNGFELLTIAPTSNFSQLSGTIVCLDNAEPNF